MKRAALLLGACAACAAPSSYDGLTGGTIADAALPAPRQISPISVSTVASSRPLLRWDLAEGLTGAVVELCRTRDCASVARTFDAKGKELVVPEDLEPGMWFWRLRGASSSRRGTTAGPTWELLVRGPAARGASAAPTGSVFDHDGDGLPDLVVGTELAYGPMVDMVYVVYYGQPDGTFVDREGESFYMTPGPGTGGPQHFAAGIDLDGDGYADLAHAGVDDVAVFVDLGRPRDARERLDVVLLPPSTNAGPVTIGVAGDTNGDGYGDFLAGGADSVFVAPGSAKHPAAALAPFVYEPRAPGVHRAGEPAAPAPPVVRAVLGGFDADGDGVSDVVAAVLQANVLGVASAGDRGGALDRGRFVELGRRFASSAAARAFASGDFDGDGIADLAYSAIVDGAARVCVSRGDAAELVGAPACADLASLDLAAADLEGDGKDELLAASQDAVVVLRLDGDALTVGARIAATAPITAIRPGRPARARWAAASTDGRAALVFEGTDETQRIGAPPDLVGTFVRALR